MTALTPGTLLLIWIGFIILAIIGVGFYFAGVIRTGHDPEQHRKGYLPTENAMREEEAPSPSPSVIIATRAEDEHQRD